MQDDSVNAKNFAFLDCHLCFSPLIFDLRLGFRALSLEFDREVDLCLEALASCIRSATF